MIGFQKKNMCWLFSLALFWSCSLFLNFTFPKFTSSFILRVYQCLSEVCMWLVCVRVIIIATVHVFTIFFLFWSIWFYYFLKKDVCFWLFSLFLLDIANFICKRVISLISNIELVELPPKCVLIYFFFVVFCFNQWNAFFTQLVRFDASTIFASFQFYFVAFGAHVAKIKILFVP